MKRLLDFPSLLGLGLFAFAEVETEAQGLLERSREVHGGEAQIETMIPPQVLELLESWLSE